MDNFIEKILKEAIELPIEIGGTIEEITALDWCEDTLKKYFKNKMGLLNVWNQ